VLSDDDDPADDAVGDVVALAPAVWSPAAMKPARSPATATLTPAAATFPCVLSFRRAMHEFCRAIVRIS